MLGVHGCTAIFRRTTKKRGTRFNFYIGSPAQSAVTYLQLQKSRKMRGFQNFVLKTDPEKLHGRSFSGTC
jgi:hypothetical protein